MRDRIEYLFLCLCIAAAYHKLGVLHSMCADTGGESSPYFDDMQEASDRFTALQKRKETFYG